MIPIVLSSFVFGGSIALVVFFAHPFSDLFWRPYFRGLSRGPLQGLPRTSILRLTEPAEALRTIAAALARGLKPIRDGAGDKPLTAGAAQLVGWTKANGRFRRGPH
jgi:hypothetical protein